MAETHLSTKEKDIVELVKDSLTRIAGVARLGALRFHKAAQSDNYDPELSPWTENYLTEGVFEQILKEASEAWNLLFDGGFSQQYKKIEPQAATPGGES